jgi:regulatory subunit for Cdc7p protein kinase
MLTSIQHIKSKKHRKFADNDENFAQLDQVLARVRRRTIREVEQENMAFLMNKQREKERMALQNQQVSPFKPDDHDPDDVFRDDF